jgi:hypothetical protein
VTGKIKLAPVSLSLSASFIRTRSTDPASDSQRPVNSEGALPEPYATCAVSRTLRAAGASKVSAVPACARQNPDKTTVTRRHGPRARGAPRPQRSDWRSVCWYINWYISTAAEMNAAKINYLQLLCESLNRTNVFNSLR